MLDHALPDDLRGLRICEPGCGHGPFLVEAARRICTQMRSARSSLGHLRSLQGLTGFDTDDTALARCRANLTAVCRRNLDDPSFTLDWNVRRADILDRTTWQDLIGRHHYVLGNPPYVRIQHLESDRRDLVATAHWNIPWKGSFDLYYLFFDAGLDMLQDNGTLSFITPSSWLKTIAARPLRQYLRSKHRIRGITDFGYSQVFPAVTTYSAITTVRRGGTTGMIPAAKASVRSERVSLTNGYEIDPSERSWSLMTPRQRRSLQRIRSHTLPLKEVATISVGIQTLADRVFILDCLGSDDTILHCTDGNAQVLLEMESVRRIVKASVMRDGRDSQSRVIIYPYGVDGRLLSLEDFRTRFPLAHAWLLRNKAILDRRDKGRCKAAWYQFGREVGVTTAFGVKILTSGLNKFPNFQVCDDADALFYSGYGIKPKPEVDIRCLLNELNSDRMSEYVQATSRPYRNGWYSYAKTFIKDFAVSKEVLRHG